MTFAQHSLPLISKGSSISSDFKYWNLLFLKPDIRKLCNSNKLCLNCLFLVLKCFPCNLFQTIKCFPDFTIHFSLLLHYYLPNFSRFTSIIIILISSETYSENKWLKRVALKLAFSTRNLLTIHSNPLISWLTLILVVESSGTILCSLESEKTGSHSISGWSGSHFTVLPNKLNSIL